MKIRETLPSWARLAARSRVVHFCVLGAALFLVAPAERDGKPIRIEAARVERAYRSEQSRLGRALTPSEKQRAMRELVDEELLYREGRRLHLDEKDPIVRARVAETMRRSLGEAVPQAKLDAAAIERRANEIATRAEPRVRLELWFVSRDRPDAAHIAQSLARSVAAAPATSLAKSPDRPPLPDDVLYDRETLGRLAGQAVAEAAFATRPGELGGPITSAWGFWLVRPVERRPVTAAEARALATADARAHASAASLDLAVARSEQDHEVEIDVPAGEPAWDPSTPRESP